MPVKINLTPPPTAVLTDNQVQEMWDLLNDVNKQFSKNPGAYMMVGGHNTLDARVIQFLTNVSTNTTAATPRSIIGVNQAPSEPVPNG